jgi:RNA polymerase sigma-70 factor (ECF subfamily)
MPLDIAEELIALLPRLRRFALHLARVRDQADDLVQAACERALATTSDRGDAPFDAWMFRIVRNLWIDGLRRQKSQGVQVDIDEQLDIAGTDGAQDTENRLSLDSVREAIDRLPDEQREVLLLVCVEELSYRDAAETLGVPIGTVMSRLSRARLRLAALTGLRPGSGGRQ